MEDKSIIEKLDENLMRDLGWLELLLCKLLSFRFIHNCDREIYLRRWFLLRADRIAIFIHKFERSDEDRHCHDHPWDFIVIPIWRGYTEHSEKWIPCDDCDGDGLDYNSNIRKCVGCDGATFKRVPTSRRVWPILGTRYRKAEYRHRVELFEEAEAFGPVRTSTLFGKPWTEQNVRWAPLPSWSIFIRFRKRRVWGFWTGFKKFIDNKTFWNINCED